MADQLSKKILREILEVKIQNELGGNYSRIKRLSHEQIKEATSKRAKYLIFFKKNGIKCAANNISKLYLNNLSPGCQTCVNGTWSCIYINHLCTRNCFFCKNNRKNKKETLPWTNYFTFHHVEEYIDYLKNFHFEGVSFSGGEPFLVFDRLVSYITKIRENFGSKHYIWIYTNGDLVNEENLEILKKIGLNELRFNISARKYDLKPVKLAVNYIDTVTIEIPVIPEDLELVKSILEKLVDIKVKYLNLHQLGINKVNAEEIIKRKYTLLNSPSPLCMLESEFTAFELLKHAIKIKTKIGINYCTGCYKQWFQARSFRKRWASYCKDNNESITEIGYLRKLCVRCSNEELDDIINLLRDELPIVQFNKKINQYEIYLPLKSLEVLSQHIDQMNKTVEVSYYDCVKKHLNFDKSQKMWTYGKITLIKDKFNEIVLENKLQLMLFLKILENKEFQDILHEIADLCNMGDKMEILEKIRIKEFYDYFETLEYLPRVLPPYF